MDKEKQKSIIKKYVFIFFLVIAIAISIILMIVYNEQGEINMPYKLDKIIIKSAIDAKSNESDKLWDLDIAQNNDIYMYIGKNATTKKEDNIKSIKVENIKTSNRRDSTTTPNEYRHKNKLCK